MFVFKPTKRTFALIELTSFKSLFLVKFQVSTLNESQHLVVNLSCQSVCENLDAISARSAPWIFSANIAVEQDAIAAAIVIAVGLFALHPLLIYKTESRVEKAQKMGRAEGLRSWVLFKSISV